MRLFIAIDLPDEIKDYLEEIQKKFSNLDKIKLADPKSMHITLKFLGEAGENKLDMIKAVVSGLSSFRKFDLRLSAAGFFTGNMNNPRVLWVSAEDKGETGRLTGFLNENLSKLGFEKENNFKAHVTLARFKDKTNKVLLEQLIEDTKIDALSFRVDKVFLKESKLTPLGPEYSDIFEVELGE